MKRTLEEVEILKMAFENEVHIYGEVPSAADNMCDEGLLDMRNVSEDIVSMCLTAKGQRALDAATLSKIPSARNFEITGDLTVTFVDEEALTAFINRQEEEGEHPPYDTPAKPFHIDEDGDICDANGWLVAVMPYGVWPDLERHAHTVLEALSESREYLLTLDEMRDKRRGETIRIMRKMGEA